jgi:hypothetical protein
MSTYEPPFQFDEKTMKKLEKINIHRISWTKSDGTPKNGWQFHKDGHFICVSDEQIDYNDNTGKCVFDACTTLFDNEINYRSSNQRILYDINDSDIKKGAISRFGVISFREFARTGLGITNTTFSRISNGGNLVWRLSHNPVGLSNINEDVDDNIFFGILQKTGFQINSTLGICVLDVVHIKQFVMSYISGINAKQFAVSQVHRIQPYSASASAIAIEAQEAEIADYNEELAIKLDLNFHRCETINGISINSSDEYYHEIDKIHATKDDLERGFTDCIETGLADEEFIDFMSVSNFVNETTEDLEKKYNNYLFSKQRNNALHIKILERIDKISQIVDQINTKYNTKLIIRSAKESFELSHYISKSFESVYDDDSFAEVTTILSRIAQISQLAEKIDEKYDESVIIEGVINEGVINEDVLVIDFINESFKTVYDVGITISFDQAISSLIRIAQISQIAQQIPPNSYTNKFRLDGFINESNEFNAVQAIQQSFRTINDDVKYQQAIQILTQIATQTNPAQTLSAGSKNKFRELTLNAGAKMTGGASLDQEQILNFINDNGHFYVNGEIFDPTWTPWINEFGKEKILYSIMFGIEVSMKKYIEELEKMAGGVGSSDKNSKRAARLNFLLLAYDQLLPYDPNDQANPNKISRPLDDYFKRMLGYFNGSPRFDFTTNAGVRHSGAKTGKVLYEIWAGGNIITCFAQLLKNIIVGDPLDSINAMAGFETSDLHKRMVIVLQNPKLIEAINEVASMSYSDFDANGCILIEDGGERAALFAGVADPQEMDFLTDQQLESIKKHLEHYLNARYFAQIGDLNSKISGFNIFRIKNKYAFKKSNKYIALEGIKETPDVSRKNIVKGLNECGADKLFVGGVENAMFEQIQTLADKKDKPHDLSFFEFYYLDTIFKSNNIKTLIIQKQLADKSTKIYQIVKTKIETLIERVREIKEQLFKEDRTYNKTHLGSAKKFVSENSLLFCDMFFRYDVDFTENKSKKKNQAISALIKFYGESDSIFAVCAESSKKSEFKQNLFSKIKKIDSDELSKRVYKYINDIETKCNLTGSKMTNKDRSTPIQDCLIAAFEQFIKDVEWEYDDPKNIEKFSQQIASSTQKKVCVDLVICEIKRIEGELKMRHLEQSFIEKYSDEVFNRIKNFESYKAEQTETSGHILHELFLKNILDQLSTSNVDEIIIFFRKIEIYLMLFNNNRGREYVVEELKYQNSEIQNYIQNDIIDSEKILSSESFDPEIQKNFVARYRENANKYSLACINFYKMMLLQKTYNNALTGFNVQCTIETMQRINMGGTEIYSIIYYLNRMIIELNSEDVAIDLNRVLPLTHSLYTLNHQPEGHHPITQITNTFLKNFFSSSMTVEISKYTTAKLKSVGLLIKDTSETLLLDDKFDKLTNVVNACVKHIASDKSCQLLYTDELSKTQCSEINNTSSINAGKLKIDLIPVVQGKIEDEQGKIEEDNQNNKDVIASIVSAATITTFANYNAVSLYAATIFMSFLYLTSNNVMIPTHMNDDNDLTDAVEDGCRIDSVAANELGIQIPRVACGVGGGKMRRKIKNNRKIKKTKKNKKSHLKNTKNKKAQNKKTKQQKQPKQKISKKRSKK